MFGLFRENVRIALDSIKTQLLRTILTIIIIGIGIWALVGILSAVKALENTIASSFSSMGSNTFNLQQYEFETQRHGGGERQKINPIISYDNVREFVDGYDYPYTQTSISFLGTRTAEVKYDNEKTDPEVQVFGVNEHYLSNTGTKVQMGRNSIFLIFRTTTRCALSVRISLKIFLKLKIPLVKPSASEALSLKWQEYWSLRVLLLETIRT